MDEWAGEPEDMFVAPSDKHAVRCCVDTASEQCLVTTAATCKDHNRKGKPQDWNDVARRRSFGETGCCMFYGAEPLTAASGAPAARSRQAACAPGCAHAFDSGAMVEDKEAEQDIRIAFCKREKAWSTRHKKNKEKMCLESAAWAAAGASARKDHMRTRDEFCMRYATLKHGLGDESANVLSSSTAKPPSKIRKSQLNCMNHLQTFTEKAGALYT